MFKASVNGNSLPPKEFTPNLTSSTTGFFYQFETCLSELPFVPFLLLDTTQNYIPLLVLYI
jgi:hypothetical protein